MDSTLMTKFLSTKFWSEVELTLIKCVPIFWCEGDPSSTSALGLFWSIIMTLSLLTVRAFDAGKLFKFSLISGGLSKSIFLKGNLAKLV